MNTEVKEMLIKTEKELKNIIQDMFKSNDFNKLDIIERTEAIEIYNMDLDISEISDIVDILDEMIFDAVESSQEYKEVLRIIYDVLELNIDFNPDIFMDILELFKISAEELIYELLNKTMKVISDNKQLLKISVRKRDFGVLKHTTMMDLRKIEGKKPISNCLINEDRTIMHYSYGLTLVREK